MINYWYPFLGWIVFWIGLIIAIVLFSSHKKVYSIFYLVSICLYIFTTGFMIDVWDFGRSAILLTLVISAVLFMGLGYYFSIVFSKSGHSLR